MAGPAVILREIHRLRKHAADLRSEIERIPRMLKTQQGKVAFQEELLKQAQEGLKKLRVATLEKESDLKATHQQMAKHKVQLNQAGGSKEFQALQHELAADQKKAQELENEILESMTAADEQAARIPDLEAAVKKAKAEFTEFEKGVEGRRAGLAQQLADAEKSIKDVEAQLPPDILPQYNRLVASKGADALSAVRGRTCLACYTEITAQNHHDLAQGQAMFCKSCGRLLYLVD